MRHEFQISPGHFVLPADLKISNANILSRIFNEVIAHSGDKLRIDCSKAYWISPFTVCWLAALVDNLRNIGKTGKIIVPKRESAKHQFDNLGVIPYLAPKRDSRSHRGTKGFSVTKLTEPSYSLAGRVVRLLTENLKGVENFHKALHFAIREVIENAFEHGQTDHCYMCAYSVPSKQLVRLCILDTGVGIPQSMISSGKYADIKDDLEAVDKASQKYVSSKSEDRGIGLYILRDVAEKNDATLTIVSGRAKLDISKNAR
ncbi:MAG: ATP-binding protein, partial [bacterium]